MNICIIFNPSAGSAEQVHELLAWVEARSDVELAATRRPDDARKIARQAATEGYERIVAAGGDGTVHGAVNGIMASGKRVTLGVIPLGTGNDLPRTLAIPEDPVAAAQLLDTGRVREMDLIKVKFDDTTLYGHNVAAGGFTGQVGEAMDDELKQTWGPLAYIRGAVRVLPDMTSYHTEIRYDGRAPSRVSAINIIVANGRTAGGGLVVAPRANPEDGLLDVVIVRTGTVMELTGVAAKLLAAGDYTTSDAVQLERARRVEIHSNPPMWFNLDGELLSNGRMTFSVVPRALRVIVGPDYTPEPV